MESKKNLIYYLSGRVIIVSLLTLTTIYISLKKNASSTNFIVFTTAEVILLLITVFSLLLLKNVEKESSLKKHAIFQVLFDILFYTFATYLTGTVESPFIILYFYTLIFSPFFLTPKTVFFSSSFAILFLGAVTDCVYFNILPLPEGFEKQDPERIFPLLISYSISFIIVSFLSILLARQLKSAKEKIEEREIKIRDYIKFFKTLLDSAPSGVMVLEPLTGKIIFSNISTDKILCLNSTQEGSVEKRVPPEFFKAIISSEENSRSEIKLICGEKKIVIGYTVAKVKVEEIDAYLVVFQDLTEVKKREEQMKINEWYARLGEFAASIAHEIRNPLATIMGSIEYVKKHIGDSNNRQEVEKFLNNTLNESNRIKKLISDFLYFSKERKGESPVEIKGLIERVVKEYSRNHKNISIDLNLKEALVTGNEPQLSHMFLNLLDNAMKFSKEEAKVKIETVKQNNMVRIHFSDRGIGIREQDKEKIFLPFYTTDSMTGTGMGLAIVKKIVENHNGEIKVKSEVGRGTEFVIIFPSSEP